MGVPADGQQGVIEYLIEEKAVTVTEPRFPGVREKNRPPTPARRVPGSRRKRRRERASIPVVRRDKTGKEKARVYFAGPPGDEITVEETETANRYFLSNWPNEDIVTFCRESIGTLEDLVNRAYTRFR